MQVNGEARGDGAVHVPPGKGESLWAIGDTYTFKGTAENTGGSLLLFEASVPPQGGPPPHIHHREDEAYYVLEGKIEVLQADHTFVAEAGSFVFIPKGTLLGFKNVGTKTARFLIMATPAGLEGFFEAVGQPAQEGKTAPPPGPEEIERAVAAAPKYGMEVPPPPGE